MAIVAMPMLWPATLPDAQTPLPVTAVSLLKPNPRPEPVKPRLVAVTNAVAMRAPASTLVETRRGGMITAPANLAEAAPVLAVGGGMKSEFSLGSGLGIGTASTTPAVAVVAARPKNPEPVRISSGVSSGMLLSPITPVYPRIAMMARTQGTVVVTATIDKRGRIVGLQVLSGPEILRNAAAEAVKQARYRPFLLNGEATEVVTTITVNFRMGA